MPVLALAGLIAASPFAAAQGTKLPQTQISGPYVHENLAVYLVHGKSAPGPVPLTLQEAIAKGSVIVHETGSVRRLTIENLGGEEVFVQFGDIVKGGRQDRVLTISLLLPAHSGRIPIGAYCVEQGRWAARGRESVSHFGSARSAVPSRRVKLALRGSISFQQK